MDVDVDNGGKSTEANYATVDDAPRPFDVVSNALASLGGLSVHDFLNHSVSSAAALDISFYVQLPTPASPEKEKGENGVKEEEEDDLKLFDHQKALRGLLANLHEAAHKVFGSSDCLKFEYLEEDPKNKQCILTITRPNGATRSYKSDPTANFAKRLEARNQVAKIAIEMGALDFIISGDSDALKAKKGLLLNPFDVEIDTEATEIAPGESKYTEEENSLRLIDETCAEWRAERMKPYWVTYNDVKNKKKHGAALRLSITTHVFRTYSVDPVYEAQRQAKIACANLAVTQGVLDFIKFGNGQTEPAKREEEETEQIRPPTPPPGHKGYTLQEFFEKLPRPFPEEIGEMTANEVNAPAWLNFTLQSARGGRLASTFTPIVDGIRHLHGCILRVDRPAEMRTYLIEPQFPKRSDAKAAVCLLAMSQGVGAYIRELKEEALNKLPEEKRKLANEKLFQVLASETGKVRIGNRLIFTFTNDRDAFGCTLKVNISPNPSEPDVREYTVDIDYRTKADAKAAVACLAVEQGLVDLLRFRGGPLPPDYTPYWEAQMNGDGDNYVAKRKDLEGDGDVQDRKKRRKGNAKDYLSEPGEVQPRGRIRPVNVKQEPLPDGIGLPAKPSFAAVLPPAPPDSKGAWKKPHADGSSGPGPVPSHASSSRLTGQDRAGYKSGGPPPPPSSYPPPVSSQHTPHQGRPPKRVGATYPSPPGAPPRSYPHPNDAYSRSDPYARVTSSYPPSTPNSYPPPAPHQPYPPPDPYHHNSYPPYPAPYPPPPGQPYHSPPVGPPPQPYPGPPVYYGGHPPAPPHGPYGHYPAPGPYPPPGYPYSHPPTPYTSPPPPPHMVMTPPYGTPVGSPHAPLPPSRGGGYRSPYSPPYSPHHQPYSPPQSPPREGPSDDYGRFNHNHQRRHTTQNGQERHDERGYYPRPEEGERPYKKGYNRNGKYSQGHGTGQSRRSVASHVPERENRTDPRSFGNRPPSPPAPAPAPKPPPKPPLGSYLTELNEFCRRTNVTKPNFMYEAMKDKDGERKFKVWAEHNAQRLEMPTLFTNFEVGRERLAKRILHWEKSRLEYTPA